MSFINSQILGLTPEILIEEIWLSALAPLSLSTVINWGDFLPRRGWAVGCTCRGSTLNFFEVNVSMKEKGNEGRDSGFIQ